MDWATVAAFIGPLIAAITLAGAWFTWLGKRRELLIKEMIESALHVLEARIGIIETTLATQNKQLDKQDSALASAMQSIARIEGRLMKNVGD